MEPALRFYRRYFRRKPFGWFGDYGSWNDAAKNCAGYDAQNILEKVKEATLKVKRGEAIWERDSVIFDQIEYSFPLLSALLWVAAESGQRLSVLDFGGSLGSSYFQNRNFLKSIETVWTIVEQKQFVDAGRESIADSVLHFEPTMQSAVETYNPNLFLISCCLQYIEKPFELIDEIVKLKIPYLIVDNTPFNFEARNRITVQKVPPDIYEASYPCWFLDYASVLARFTADYEVVTEFVNDTIIELDGHKIPYQGFLLALKNS